MQRMWKRVLVVSFFVSIVLLIGLSTASWGAPPERLPVRHHSGRRVQRWLTNTQKTLVPVLFADGFESGNAGRWR